MPALIELVRIFLKDSPSVNELPEAFDFDDREIAVACDMAISDWNTTPPLIRPQKLETFIARDWLVVATAINCLQTLVFLNARNQLAYNDGGITVDRWNKAPVYMSIVQYWKPILEEKKKALKYAMNVAATSGMVLSSEFTMWKYMDHWQGIGLTVPINVKPPKAPKQPPKPVTIHFVKGDWTSIEDGTYTCVLRHNLGGNVDIRLTDPGTREDLRSKAKIVFKTDNSILLTVPKFPDGRFDGQALVYKI